jgi:hemoglobin/transferrin/lactoferrin receptor protein
MTVCRAWSLGIAAATLLAANAAENSSQLDDMVVVASGHEASRFTTPYTTYDLNPDDIRLRLQAPIFPEALRDVPGVMLQKTGHGMTSPYLRGFTSQRTVLLADGIQLNNSFLREGPNQYWTLVDPFFYREVEVMMGPASALYGSDAIGGVVYARSAPLSQGRPGSGLTWHGGEIVFRYAQAERSFSEHVEGEIGMADAWSLRLGLTRQDFGDLRTGNDVGNENTDFEQWGANLRLQIWLDDNESLTVGYDHVDQDDIDRVHRTIEHRDFHGTLSKGSASDLRRVYDHDRRTAFAHYRMCDGSGLFDEADIHLFYTYFAENYLRIKSRTDWRYRPTDIDTLGGRICLRKFSDWGRWDVGVDVTHDWVDARGWNVRDGARTELPQGVVADDATYLLAGVFAQNEAALTDRLILTTGVRFDHARLRAGDVAFSNPDRVGDMEANWSAVTGSLRALYKVLPDDRLNVFAGASQGFRAPNLSDATREDDFGGGQESPTADLDAERFTTLEAGLKHRGERTLIEAAVYHTFIKDRIGRLTLDGNATKRNLDNGYVQGIELLGTWRFLRQFEAFGWVAWQRGEEDTYAGAEILNGTTDRPLSRMHPLSAEVGLRWQHPGDRCWIECAVRMADRQDKLAPAEKNDNRFPPGATPGYAVVNLRTGVRIAENTDLALALENIGDREYRVHGSGVNEPGRQFVVTLRHTF